MNNMIDQEFAFPVGFHKFNNKQVYNFQLNRFYSLGFARFEDMVEVGKKIEDYSDWKIELVKIANQALREDRLLNAAMYFRAAEFYTLPEDPEKIELYNKFNALFYEYFEGNVIQKFNIPYEEFVLPALKIASRGKKKGTILIHGGMDSFIEEWIFMMKYLSDHDYDVIGFEGPGQGAALIKSGAGLDIEWEKPVSAILDYFNLDDVTLIGLSVGGWLCLRAAAHESRVKRVIASGHAIHYMEIVPAAISWIMTFFMKYENFFNKSSYWKMEKNPRMKWEIGQTMHITKTKTPYDAAMKLNFSLTRENMKAENITQDVLFFSGEEDHFIPIRLHNRQVNALTNARSVTDRIFTKSESAQNHCQIGNIGLALDTMIDWIDKLLN
ncbi:MAG: alpha/beta fold hydrolase [Anaerolineaceae bacterium]|nr:alpha/beta fold hydrolase [Anaerolineaceae bacterium]